MGIGLPPVMVQWLPHARAAELACGVDSLLLLAIVHRESLGGECLVPRGPGGKGDHGHGHGLAQLDDRYHPTLIAAVGPDGKPLWADPGFAFFLLAYFLRYLRERFSACGVDPILPAIAAYNASVARVEGALQALPLPITRDAAVLALDALTTGADYVTDVLARRGRFVIH